MYESINDITKEKQNEIENTKEVGTETQEDVDIYVVSTDGTPIHYTRSFKSARNHMLDTAQIISFKNTGTYRIQIEDKMTTLEVVGQNKFFLIGYDKVIARLSITQISEVSLSLD